MRETIEIGIPISHTYVLKHYCFVCARRILFLLFVDLLAFAAISLHCVYLNANIRGITDNRRCMNENKC